MQFVAAAPSRMKAVGLFQTAGNPLIVPGSRDDVARRLATGTSGWNAVATGVNGLVGVVPNARSEQNAIEGALADCSRHDRGCQVIAIGPFSVVAAELGKAPSGKHNAAGFARSANGGLIETAKRIVISYSRSDVSRLRPGTSGERYRRQDAGRYSGASMAPMLARPTRCGVASRPVSR
jgi:hypothetical protein